MSPTMIVTTAIQTASTPSSKPETPHPSPPKQWNHNHPRRHRRRATRCKIPRGHPTALCCSILGRSLIYRTGQTVRNGLVVQRYRGGTKNHVLSGTNQRSGQRILFKDVRAVIIVAHSSDAKEDHEEKWKSKQKEK